MITELHLLKQSTPDGLVKSYFQSVLLVSSALNLKFNERECPIFESELVLDDGDLVVSILVKSILHSPFDEPQQVVLAQYSQEDDVGILTVKKVLLDKSKDRKRIKTFKEFVEIEEVENVKTGDEISTSLGRLSIRAVIQNNELKLIWNKVLDEKIRRLFFEQAKRDNLKIISSAEVDDLSSDEATLKLKSNDKEIMYKSLLLYRNWFRKKFPMKTKINETHLL